MLLPGRQGSNPAKLALLADLAQISPSDIEDDHGDFDLSEYINFPDSDEDKQSSPCTRSPHRCTEPLSPCFHPTTFSPPTFAHSQSTASAPHPACLSAASPLCIPITPLGGKMEDEDEEGDDEGRGGEDEEDGDGDGDEEEEDGDGDGEEDEDGDGEEDEDNRDGDGEDGDGDGEENGDGGQQHHPGPRMTPALMTGALPQNHAEPLPNLSVPSTLSLPLPGPWHSRITPNVMREIHQYFPHQFTQDLSHWNYIVLSPGTSADFSSIPTTICIFY